VFFQSFALARELEEFPEMMMSQRPSRQIDTWRVPRNWSRRDWLDEMKAEVIAAAWEAELDFDPTRGVPLEAFVQRRVWARAWGRYRREWTYARRCGLQLKGGDCGDLTANGFSPVEVSESLRHALDRLPEHQRELIVRLFWEEKTEVEIARMLSLSQQAISKQKRRILALLRYWMGPLEKEEVIKDFK
jgi:RNA polymerase sigma factor (sigma-70 family)